MKKITLSRPVKYIVNIVLILSLLAAIVGLNIMVQNNTSTERTRTATKASKLDIAIVNEDQPVQSENAIYTLGSSYIKTIERDDTHNWSVVGRGTAETGLKNGDYQLIIFIPNDFSKKLLDINNVNVEKTVVTYKINSNGNLQVENEANKVGKDIVADLNAQLIDMYMASILSNLYTAQGNVQTIADTQADNINSYRSHLYDSATSFQNVFPSLVATSNSSITANDGLTEMLNASNTLYETMTSSQETFRTNLEALVAKRSQDQMTYSDFIAALVTMKDTILNAETEQLLNQLKADQEQLTIMLGQETTDETGQVLVDGYKKSLKTIEEDINELEKLLTAERNKIDDQLNAVDTSVEEAIQTYYNKTATELTLNELLNKENATAIASQDYQAKLKAIFQEAVNQLPDVDQNKVAPYLMSVATPAIHYDANAVINGGYSTANPNTALMARLQSTHANYLKLQSDEKTFAATAATPTMGTVTVTDTGATVIVKDWTLTVDGTTTSHLSGESVNVDFSKDYQIGVNYEYTSAVTMTSPTPASPATPTPATPAPTTPAPATPVAPTATTETGQVLIEAKQGTTTTKASFDYDAYIKAATDYASAAQETADAYNAVYRLLSAYQTPTGDLTTDFLNTPMTDNIKELLKYSLTANLTAYKDLVATDTTLTDQLTKLQSSREELMTKFADIQATNQNLTNQIAVQLTNLENLRTQVNNLDTLQTANDTAQEAANADLTGLGEELQALLTSTTSMQESSRANTEEANQVNSIFENFNKEVESAQSLGQDLSASATNLMTQFDEELSQSNDFVSSFVKVLNNAYSNGVPNEVLLDFLSNPVGENTSSIKATVNVYRPFTWILLLEVVTLFTAYLFATQNLIKTVKDKFNVNRFAETDLLNVLILSALSLVIGITLGVVSSNRLGIESEYVPSWVLLVVLFAFLLVQAQYFALKNFKAVGMGLILFMIISFVYLSNAIGTTASLAGLPAALKEINPLSILETRLSSYFDGVTASLITIVLTALFSIGLSIENIFVTLSWEKKEITEE